MHFIFKVVDYAKLSKQLISLNCCRSADIDGSIDTKVLSVS